jgi:hypothetical protein
MSYFFIVRENLIFLRGCDIILIENEMRCIMYITLDILQKRGACQESLDFFAKHYPDGVEMMQAI